MLSYANKLFRSKAIKPQNSQQKHIRVTCLITWLIPSKEHFSTTIFQCFLRLLVMFIWLTHVSSLSMSDHIKHAVYFPTAGRDLISCVMWSNSSCSRSCVSQELSDCLQFPAECVSKFAWGTLQYFLLVTSQRCQTFLLANWMQSVNMLLHQEHILNQPISSDVSRTQLLSCEP